MSEERTDEHQADEGLRRTRRLFVPELDQEIHALLAAHAGKMYPPDYILGKLEVLFWLQNYDWYGAREQAAVVMAIAEGKGGRDDHPTTG